MVRDKSLENRSWAVCTSHGTLDASQAAQQSTNSLTQKTATRKSALWLSPIATFVFNKICVRATCKCFHQGWTEVLKKSLVAVRTEVRRRPESQSSDTSTAMFIFFVIWSLMLLPRRSKALYDLLIILPRFYHSVSHLG